jgi:hypothetical protein
MKPSTSAHISLDTLSPLLIYVSGELFIVGSMTFSLIIFYQYIPYSEYKDHASYDEEKAPKNTVRWFKLIKSLPEVKQVFSTLPAKSQVSRPMADKPAARKEEGKFVDLPGAEMGKVVVRFPPEASG